MASQIDNFNSMVEASLYPLVIDEYQEVMPQYPDLCEVLPWDARFMLGEKSQSVIGVGEPDEVAFGQEAPDRQFLDSWAVYARSRKYAHKLSITVEEMDAINSIGRLPASIEDFFVGQGRAFRRKKEKLIANILQKGTLTAGNAEYFNGTFSNETDPYPLYIYDGQPFFDTAHNLKASSTTPANHTVSAALSEATLQAALTLMERTSAVDERGSAIENPMDTLLVPTGLEWTARVLLESALKAGSANNDKNLLQGRLALKVNRYLTDDADAWWLLRTQGRRAIRVRDSGEPRLRVFMHEPTNRVVMELASYFSATVQDWRGAFNANKAAS